MQSCQCFVRFSLLKSSYELGLTAARNRISIKEEVEKQIRENENSMEAAKDLFYASCETT
jgi:hypothetical protein